jgi:hypothetical protein
MTLCPQAKAQNVRPFSRQMIYSETGEALAESAITLYNVFGL